MLLVGVELSVRRLDSDGNRAFFVSQNGCATGKERLWTPKERTARWTTHTMTRQSGNASSASSRAMSRKVGAGDGSPLSGGRSPSAIG